MMAGERLHKSHIDLIISRDKNLAKDKEYLVASLGQQSIQSLHANADRLSNDSHKVRDQINEINSSLSFAADPVSPKEEHKSSSEMRKPKQRCNNDACSEKHESVDNKIE